MPYEKCAEVSEELWKELEERDPREVAGRTGVIFQEGEYRLPFLERELRIDPARRQIRVHPPAPGDPGFQACLSALTYLLHLVPKALGPGLSPLELPGGATFFRGHHRLPKEPLESRFGHDQAGFLAAGQKLKAETRPAGDAALALRVFPGLTVEVILWQADEEFPAQVSFILPAHLDRFWFLDAVWGLLNLVTHELLKAGAREQ
jgi:hypothetical protein